MSADHTGEAFGEDNKHKITLEVLHSQLVWPPRQLGDVDGFMALQFAEMGEMV